MLPLPSSYFGGERSDLSRGYCLSCNLLFSLLMQSMLRKAWENINPISFKSSCLYLYYTHRVGPVEELKDADDTGSSKQAQSPAWKSFKIGIIIELRWFHFFLEPVPEPEPQSCSAKRASTGADSTEESVPVVEPATLLELIPYVKSAPEFDTQFLDWYKYPKVRKKAENEPRSRLG